MTLRDPQSGFTLIEALVAMAVLALGAVSLLTATEGHVARITALTERTAARWVADYSLTAARLGLDAASPVVMLGRSYPVNVTMAGTSDPDLQSISVAVSSATPATGNSSDATLSRLTGYSLLRIE